VRRLAADLAAARAGAAGDGGSASSAGGLTPSSASVEGRLLAKILDVCGGGGEGVKVGHVVPRSPLPGR